MSRFLLTLIFALAIFALTQSKEHCPENEVFSPCNGHCQKTCEDPIPACPKICVPGCICKGNFLRNEMEECIPPKCCNSQSEESNSTEGSESSEGSN